MSLSLIGKSIARSATLKLNETAAILRDKQPTKKLYLFDTFAGMPETDPTKDLHKQGDFADTSVEAVAQYLRCDARCYIRKGLIPDTFVGLEDERIAFIHIDLDIYQQKSKGSGLID